MPVSAVVIIIVNLHRHSMSACIAKDLCSTASLITLINKLMRARGGFADARGVGGWFDHHGTRHQSVNAGKTTFFLMEIMRRFIFSLPAIEIEHTHAINELTTSAMALFACAPFLVCHILVYATITAAFDPLCSNFCVFFLRSIKCVTAFISIAELFEDLEYGPAPESAAVAHAWMAEHDKNFGHFVNGEWYKPEGKQITPCHEID